MTPRPMPTRVVDAERTAGFDIFVGRGRKKPLPDGRVYESSDLSPAYMRHNGYIDWRDVQAWRYWRTVHDTLLFDARLRELCRDHVKGRVIASLGDQGVRTAGILAWLVDNSGIIEHADNELWLKGYADAIEGKHLAGSPLGDYIDGYNAACRVIEVRASVCGVPPDFEDPGESDTSVDG